MTNNTIQLLENIFKQDYYSESFNPEGECYDIAQSIIKTNPFSEIYEWFLNYLKEKCINKDQIDNALNLYYCYAFDKQEINSPFEFIAYIIKTLNLQNRIENFTDFYDSLFLSILETNHLIDLEKDPYYDVLKDKRIVDLLD